ncbi:hypothetical protein HK101_011427 [Irineochytrium annulatum]|nr:hypothetical protein HK101_011427 [Irineochytrium annulatum]
MYEFACKRMIDAKGEREGGPAGRVYGKDDLSAGQLMFAGALAGMTYNLTLFPADLIKSRQQIMEVGPNVRSGFGQIAADIWRAQGVKGFYRGCGITVARSAPTSAVIFGSYEWMCRHIAF